MSLCPLHLGASCSLCQNCTLLLLPSAQVHARECHNPLVSCVDFGEEGKLTGSERSSRILFISHLLVFLLVLTSWRLFSSGERVPALGGRIVACLLW